VGSSCRLVLLVTEVKVLDQLRPMPGGLLFLLQLLDLLRQLLYLLLHVKKLETAVSTVHKLAMLTFRKIQAMSTNQAFQSPGGLQTTPNHCSRPQQKRPSN
jgi:hypothetical protein